MKKKKWGDSESKTLENNPVLYHVMSRIVYIVFFPNFHFSHTKLCKCGKTHDTCTWPRTWKKHVMSSRLSRRKCSNLALNSPQNLPIIFTKIYRTSSILQSVHPSSILPKLKGRIWNFCLLNVLNDTKYFRRTGPWTRGKYVLSTWTQITPGASLRPSILDRKASDFKYISLQLK